MQKFQGVSTPSDHRKMNQSSLEPSWQGASNGGIYMSLALLDGKLFSFYCLEIFANNFLFIGPNDMKILQLDAPGYGESNKPMIINFWSLVDEIMQFNCCVFATALYFW